MTLVSVIMNCYNSEKYLREAIDSVFRQTLQDFEIIFWDNLSTDRSPQIAQSYGPQLKYYRGVQFLSLGSARNEAISKAMGQYITFLDCDDKWEPNKLAIQVQRFEKQPDADLVYTNFYTLDDTSGGERIALTGEQPEQDIFEQLLCYNPIGLLTVMVKAESLLKLDHLFDPKLNLAEEYDVFMRLLFRGKAYYIKEPLAYYRIHAGMTSITLKKGWPEEKEYVLGKLKNLCPDFEQKYKEAIRSYVWEIEYIRGKNYMIEGYLAEARRHMAVCKYFSFKTYCLYLACFLPRGLWLALKPLWAKGRFR